MFRFRVNTRPPPLSRPQEVNHVNVPPNAKAASCPTIMRIKCLNIVVNNAGVRLPAWAAAGGDWRSVLNHQTSFGQMHICSQVARCTRWHFTVNLASFLHCCRLDLLPNWFRHLHSRGRGRSLSAFPQLVFIINSNCERARVTQSQATSCPICLATGHAHVPHFNIISQARLPKQRRGRQRESYREGGGGCDEQGSQAEQALLTQNWPNWMLVESSRAPITTFVCTLSPLLADSACAYCLSPLHDPCLPAWPRSNHGVAAAALSVGLESI